MKRIPHLLLIALGAFLISQSSEVDAAVVKKPIARNYASTTQEILTYLQKRPFYSTTTKDLIIKSSARATSTLLIDPGLFQIIQTRNGLYEEQGNYYIPKCENELTNAEPQDTTVSYFTDAKTRRPQTIISTANKAVSVTVPYGLLSWKHYSTTTPVTDMEKRNMKNTYYFEDTSGYTYSFSLDVYPYSLECAKWTEDRNKFTSESIGGWTYGLSLYVPVETLVYEIRGKMMAKGVDVRTMYRAFPEINNRWGGVFKVSPFEGSIRDKTSAWAYSSWYTFRKGSNIIYLSITTDNPKPKMVHDTLLSLFLR